MCARYWFERIFLFVDLFSLCSNLFELIKSRKCELIGRKVDMQLYKTMNKDESENASVMERDVL